jgi:hypothetical protein
MFSPNKVKVKRGSPIDPQSPEMQTILNTDRRDLIVYVVCCIILGVVGYPLLFNKIDAIATTPIFTPTNLGLFALHANLGFFALCGAMLIGLIAMVRWYEGNLIKQIFTQDSFAVWHHSNQEWQAEFEARLKTDQRKLSAILVAISILYACLMFVLIQVVALPYPQRSSPLAVNILGGIAWMGLVGALIYFWERRRIEERRKRAQNADGAWSVFGGKGYYHQLSGFKALNPLIAVDTAEGYIIFQTMIGKGGIASFKVKAPASVSQEEIDQLVSQYRRKIQGF